ncbi:hydrogenase maturation protease [Chitinibacter bivalviorum]|uniref:Hydrogenase maturation protease n=1 Tax=Chitinibacter bivalviorum TaxID=2739434 RepID=A0A7H9BGQ4_9NEIS|nr:hydrogenase maturation protease [Chitinibacter bivalviorum]QLG87903.1 hydrogenase maturation protease [Chitinibacter bivalviorum]
MAPILFFAYGNPARGDDALGPLLADMFSAWISSQQLHTEIDVLFDFQLSPEHAYDITGRELIIFADASNTITEPCCWQIIEPCQPPTWLSHASTPAHVLWHCDTLLGNTPKLCYIISLHGYTYELGDALSASAHLALEQAHQLLQDFILCHLNQRHLKLAITAQP